MSFEDLPQFPKKFKPRGDVLIQKMERNEITTNEVINTVFSVMKKLRIDSSGVSVTGDFGSMVMNSKVYDILNQSLDKIVPYVMYWAMEFVKRRISTIGKNQDQPQQIYIKFGERIVKFTFYAFMVVPMFASEQEIRTTNQPIVEIIPGQRLMNGGNPVLDAFKWYIGSAEFPPITDYIDMKVHRPELVVEFMDLLITSWADIGDVLELIVPMSALITRESLEKLSASYEDFWDEVFIRFGV